MVTLFKTIIRLLILHLHYCKSTILIRYPRFQSLRRFLLMNTALFLLIQNT